MKEDKDGIRTGVQAWEQTSDAHVLPLRAGIRQQEVNCQHCSHEFDERSSKGNVTGNPNEWACEETLNTYVGTCSLSIHIPQCQKKWLMEEEQKPKNERRQLPPQPNAGKAIGTGSARAFEDFNVE